VKHLHERGIAKAKQKKGGNLASIFRFYTGVLDSKIRNFVKNESEISEKRKKANRKLLHLVYKLRQSDCNLQFFKAHVTILLQQDKADINVQFANGKTLLATICEEAEISDQNQYNVILFLLEQGADPNQGKVLRWIVYHFYKKIRCKHSEYVTLMKSVIRDYNANVNYQDKRTGNTLLYDICKETEMRNSDQYCVRCGSQ
jgi:hypothetical protein